MSTIPEYKLTYFNLKARAEPIRLALAAAGVQYEDVRIKFEDWPKIKGTLPQAVLPTLEIGGKTLVQSNAISRFVAREHGMYGKNNVESTQIDAIIETTADLNVAFRTARQKADADTQAEVTKKLYEEEGPRYLGYIEKLIEAAGKDGYAVSNSLSLADCYIHATVDTLGLKAILEKFPKVAACVKRVEENANVAKWLKERPKTDY